MICNSCGGNMEFNKEKYGFSCPYCGAFEKLEADLSEEEIQKLINDSITKHRQIEHVKKDSSTDRVLNSTSLFIGNAFLFIFAFICAIIGVFSFLESFVIVGSVAVVQMFLIVAALFIRCINRSGEDKKLAVISNYLIIAAMVLVIVFFIVVGLDKH